MTRPAPGVTRAKVLDALLAGREINCTLFAREIGVSDATVNRTVQDVRDALDERSTRCGAVLRIYYRMRDEQRLRRVRQAVISGGSADPVFNFAPLLRRWKLDRPRDIDLPTRAHRIYMAADSLFGRDEA